MATATPAQWGIIDGGYDPPSRIVFRLGDGWSWAGEPFECDVPAQLLASLPIQITAAMVPYVAGAHPRLDLRRRLVEIDSWLDERLARVGTTRAQIDCWRSQAGIWRALAMDESRITSMNLQVQFRDEWINPDATARTLRVRADREPVTAALCERAWATALRGIRHATLLSAWCHWTAALAAETIGVVSPRAARIPLSRGDEPRVS